VPNRSAATVGLRDVLMSPEFKKATEPLSVVVGRDVAGGAYTADIGAMPHLLIAGSTGSGKSVCVNVLILSLLFRNSPDDLRFILVDPKRVELSVYNGIPHLLTPVITEVDKTVNALKWAVAEMDRRYQMLSEAKKKSLATYNEGAEDPLPHIVIIIDELADLMAVSANEVEGAIIRLAQMARAVGIHLVLATQRPSVNVITGLIKANITTRIAFNVASSIDSRTILDHAGAEKLLGKGDMLYITANLSKPKRLQGAYVGEKEIGRIVKFLKANAGEAEYNEGVVEKQKGGSRAGGSGGGDDGDDDELIGEAKQIVFRAGKASASLLQRRLRIGYARAARLLDIMEDQGFIGPADGARPREVLVDDLETTGPVNAVPAGIPNPNPPIPEDEEPQDV
jgi:S-DNA-T family DNA segregation ATPase FtsK/SpoIIIE